MPDLIEKDHREGHRARLKERFRIGGADTMPDYELLEMLLFRSIPRRDTKKLAKDLIAKFGTFAEVIAAAPARLLETSGIGESTVTDLKLVAASAKRLTRIEVMNKPVLSSWNAILEYCRVEMAFEVQEQFRILFLDKSNTLIAAEVQQRGTVDHTPVYPREIVKRALELSSTAIILVHNHPSGDPAPSNADVKMTAQIIEIARPLGIVVHDHVIIGRKGHFSFKGKGLM